MAILVAGRISEVLRLLLQKRDAPLNTDETKA